MSPTVALGPFGMVAPSFALEPADAAASPIDPAYVAPSFVPYPFSRRPAAAAVPAWALALGGGLVLLLLLKAMR